MKFVRIFAAIFTFLAILTAAGYDAAHILINERQLFNALENISHNPQIENYKDTEIRQNVQTLARNFGFYLEFEDVFIRYLPDSPNNKLPPPQELGYTLRIQIPLFFGIWNWPVVVCRTSLVSGSN